MPGNLCPKCACSHNTPPAGSCGDHSYCKDWCVPTRAAQARAPQCPCPCSGGRWYPSTYKIFWSGIALTSAKFRSSFDPEQYCQISGVESASWDNCNGFGDHSPVVTYDIYDADQTTLISSGNLGSITDGFKTGVSRCDNKLIVSYGFDVNVAGLGWEITSAIQAEEEVHGPPYTASAQVVSACAGGSVGCSTVVSPANSPPIENPITALGSILVVPVCVTCDGDPVGVSDTLAGTCGSALTAQLYFYNGTDMGGSAVYDFHEFAMVGGPTSWAGGGGSVSNGTNPGTDILGNPITTLCCPEHDANLVDGDVVDGECAGGADCSGGCSGCWTGSFSTGDGRSVTMFGSGDCPGGMTLISGSGFGSLPTNPDGPLEYVQGYATASMGFVGSDCP